MKTGRIAARFFMPQAAVTPCLHREHSQIGKTQKPSSMTRSARAFPGAGRFPSLPVFPVR